MGLTPHARPVTAETTALSTAFSLRADYERAVIAADSAYASALATGNSQAFADLAAAISANKFAAIDSLADQQSTEFAMSAQHAPTWDASGHGSVFVDRYSLNIDNVLDAIDAWDAEHPVVTNPPSVPQPPLDLGLPVTAPEWLSLFQEAFGDLPEAK